MPVAKRAPASRRKARVVALQVLYEIDCARHDAVRALVNRLAEDPLTAPVEAFARELLDGVLRDRERIDGIISTHAPAWPVEQLAAVDRNILRVAVYEMMVGRKTPPKVAINEAVELGKVFGSDSSPRFINGVLGSVIEKLDAEGES